jgi:hypothetical protein
MHTHILKCIVHAGYKPRAQEVTVAPAEVEIITSPTQITQTHTHDTHTSTESNQDAPDTDTWTRPHTPPRPLEETAASLLHTHNTHTHSTQGKRGASQRSRQVECREDTTWKQEQGHRSTPQVSTTNTTHTHITARDCPTHTTSTYWEGSINDQCEVCN